MNASDGIRCTGHSLVELVAATACSAILLAGLGSVMLIAHQIAGVPSASTARIEAAAALDELMYDLRFATIITEYTAKDDSSIPGDIGVANVARRNQIAEELTQVLEFVVPDRDMDDRAERIRFDWPLHPDPTKRAEDSDPEARRFRLYRSVFLSPDDPLDEEDELFCRIAGRPARTWLVAETPLTTKNNGEDVLAYELGLIVDESSQPLVAYTHAVLRLLAWPNRMPIAPKSRSLVNAAVPLLARPKRLSAYWRTDFDPGVNPTSIDVDGNGFADWLASGGADFTDMDGTWIADVDLATIPINSFASPTVVEARCKYTGPVDDDPDPVPVLRINADRRSGQGGGSYLPLTVSLQWHADETLSLTLLGVNQPALSEPEPLLTNSTVENLANDFVRFRLTIDPEPDPEESTVELQVNGIDIGTFRCSPTMPLPADRCVKIYDAEFDYIEVRVGTN